MKSILSFSVVLPFFAVTVACGATSENSTETLTHASSMGETLAPTSALPATPPAACALTPHGQRKACSVAEFRDLFVGTWLACSSPSVFGTTDDVGLEITPDGHWYKLVADANGNAVPASGWGHEGSWETVDTSVENGPCAYQVNLNIDGSGGVITFPDFAETPDVMRLDNEGVFAANYVRVDATTAAPPPATK
jgi:hypothetical protein